MNRTLRFIVFVAICLAIAYFGRDQGGNRLPADAPRSERRTQQPRTTSARVAPATITGRVVAVLDGDSIELVDEQRQRVTVRLEGIDAPERGQAFGNRSRDRLNELCYNQRVTVDVSGLDQYDRSLGVARIGDTEINATMVRDGLAWRYMYSDRKDLAQLEAEARRESRGLWRDRNPMPPWEWRRENPRDDR